MIAWKQEYNNMKNHCDGCETQMKRTNREDWNEERSSRAGHQRTQEGARGCKRVQEDARGRERMQEGSDTAIDAISTKNERKRRKYLQGRYTRVREGAKWCEKVTRECEKGARRCDDSARRVREGAMTVLQMLLVKKEQKKKKETLIGTLLESTRV